MIENLKFNVAQILKGQFGSVKTADITVPLTVLAPELSLPETTPSTDLSGSISLTLVNNGILVRGKMEAALTLECVRCLDPVGVQLKVNVEEVFAPTVDIQTGKSVVPEEDDQALWINDQHILDLQEVLHQNLLLSLPARALCRSDCKGFCPTCGQNLNEGICDCQPEPDPRWDALSALLKDTEA